MTNDPTRANNAQVQIKHGYVYGDGPTNYPVGTKMPDDIKDVVERLGNGNVEMIGVGADHIRLAIIDAKKALTTLSEENAAMKAEIEQLKDASPVRKLEGDAKWIATDLIEKIEAKDKEIERLRGKVRPKKKEKSPLQKAEQYKANLVWERYQCTGNNLTIPQGLDEEIMKATAKIKALKDTP